MVFGMTWLRDTMGTLVVLEVMWYSAVIMKKLNIWIRNVDVDFNRFIGWVSNLLTCKYKNNYYDILLINRVDSSQFQYNLMVNIISII